MKKGVDDPSLPRQNGISFELAVGLKQTVRTRDLGRPLSLARPRENEVELRGKVGDGFEIRKEKRGTTD